MDGISGDVTKSRSDNDVMEQMPAQVPEDRFDELREASLAPALKPRAPPGRSAPPRGPAPANVASTVKRFANEPLEPAIDLKTQPAAPEELQKQIATIEQYIADMKNVLGLAGNDTIEKLLNGITGKVTHQFARDGAKTKVDGLAQKIALIKLLDAELKNFADVQSERQKEYDDVARKKALFLPPGDTVVNVCVTEKGKAPVNANIRFFDDPLDLAKENKRRSLLGLSPLPETFIKKVMVTYLDAEISSSQAALTQLAARSQDLKSTLSEIEKEKSGDIALNLDAAKAFNAKIVILKKWESGLQKRKKAPAEVRATQKSQPVTSAAQTDPLEHSQAFRIGQRSAEGLARFIV